MVRRPAKIAQYYPAGVGVDKKRSREEGVSSRRTSNIRGANERYEQAPQILTEV